RVTRRLATLGWRAQSLWDCPNGRHKLWVMLSTKSEGKKAHKSRLTIVRSSHPTLHAPRFAAFTLIELMVAVALMSFIILGLLAMFTQTQRAFRASMTQTDVLESGRIATDMIVRELAQISASDRPYTTNFFAEVLKTF